MKDITNGHIHTTELALYEKNGHFVNRRFITDDRVTYHIIREPQPQVRVHFNPNKWFTEEHRRYMGTCGSLADYMTCLHDWSDENDITFDFINIMRVDFCMDCFEEENAGRFKSLCDLLLYAFAIRFDVAEKDQNWNCTSFSRQNKSHTITARLKDETYTFTIYNKGIQQESNGAMWRLELRYSFTDRSKRVKDRTSPREPLEAIKALVHELRVYFYQATEKLTQALAEEYAEFEAEYPKHADPYQFLLQHSDRLFLNSQVYEFFEILGYKNARRKQKYFFEKYRDALALSKNSEIVNRGDMVKFTKEINAAIDKWLEKAGNWKPHTVFSWT